MRIPLPFLRGCASREFVKKRTTDDHGVAKFAIATAFLVSNPYSPIITGTIIPPPPRPPVFVKVTMPMTKKQKENSSIYMGN